MCVVAVNTVLCAPNLCGSDPAAAACGRLGVTTRVAWLELARGEELAAQRNSSAATMAARATKEVGFLTGAKWFRLCCEQEPVVVVSAIMGGIGLLMPCILGDGGRAAEEASSNYAYRIRKQYPAESGA